MSSLIRILSPGLLASIQDKGRFGFGGDGVPRSGAADPISLRLGNALVGNEPYEAAIEFRFLGPKITTEQGAVRIGLAANIGAEIIRAVDQETQSVSPWQSVTLQEGDILTFPPLKNGATGYLTIEGGLKLNPVLNSCSTYMRAKLGGITGLTLQVGDILQTREPTPAKRNEKILGNPLSLPQSPLRVILGPQDDYFSNEEIAKFCSQPFKVSTDVDRMGIRLEGDPVQSLPEKGNDLISDGLLPGAIQIPGSGQPIILFIDCQSVGGYPKIAAVIAADLFRLGQLTPGTEITFKSVDLAEAQQALRDLEKSVQTSIASLQDYLGEGAINLEALYQSNLVDGMVDARSPGHFPGHLEPDT